MSLVPCDSSDDDDRNPEYKIDLAPVYADLRQFDVVQTHEIIQANLPVDEQKLHLAPKKDKDVEKITMTDAVWQDVHYSKKSKKKKKKKNHRIIPWDENRPEKKEPSITDRIAYQQRNKNRSWFPAIGDTKLEETVVWHNVIQATDRLGHSWTAPKLGVDYGEHECYLPTKAIHRFTYHTSSVSNVEMYPITGNFILSSSNDTTVRIWAIDGDRQCIQTYLGHTNSIVDISFCRDGSKFASCCFNKNLKLWETDSGKVVDRILLDSIPTQLHFNTSEDHQNEVILSLQDGRAVHYDFRIGGIAGQSPVREYKSHKGNLNSFTFLPQGNFFVTSGMDCVVTLWETGNPEPIAHVRDPRNKQILALEAHPTQPYVLGQMENEEIVVFKTNPNFVSDKKRSFSGHNIQTFACRFTMSPDGKYVASGDSTGSLYIWDWESTLLKKKFNMIHNHVIIRSVWSPHNPSHIVTASYDNTLSLFD